MTDLDQLKEGIFRREPRALARALSIVEDSAPTASTLLKDLYSSTGHAFCIGITGAPGAGKSTLVDQLIKAIVRQEKSVAVLAVDPSSPFGGGAVLGDRIRMLQSSMLPGVFVRSMASRGALGGLSPKAAEAFLVLDAAGFDYVIIETVGVGQSEIDVIRLAHAVAVVLVPGLGDSVQALKAGILEIGDVMVINKADRPGVDALRKELIGLLQLDASRARKPEIVETVATEGKGVTELVTAIENFRAWSHSNPEQQKRKFAFFEYLLRQEVGNRLWQSAVSSPEGKKLWNSALEDISQKKSSPQQVAEDFAQKIVGKGSKKSAKS